jgi:Lrp/AsnC family leucine-responsive transcriptional regulator
VPKNAAISENDAQVLRILQADGRRSYADLGADVGMAGPSAHERVKKLEARGIIRGYAADIDPAAVGLPVLGFTWVTQAPGSSGVDLTPRFAAIDEIEECHAIAGEADYLLKIRARDMAHLGDLVHRVQAIEHVLTTETDVAFRTVFEHRPLPIAATSAKPDGDSGRTG